MNYAFIYPGQGSQVVNMGKDLYDNFSFVREDFDKISEFCNIDFKELIFTENNRLNISEFTQPAILLNSIMHYKVLQNLLNTYDINMRENRAISSTDTPSLGHSLGEFSALCANGALDLDEAVKLVNLRGKFMQECASEESPASMMVILGLEDKIVEDICEQERTNKKEIYAANYNCDGQIVVAGLKKDLEESAQIFKDAGAKRAMLLNMSVASHCPLMQSASEKLTQILKINDNFYPIISNATLDVITNKNQAINSIALQLTKPVLYKQSIQKLESSVDGFIEFGSSVLAGLNKKITKKETISLKNLNDIENFVTNLKDSL